MLKFYRSSRDWNARTSLLFIRNTSPTTPTHPGVQPSFFSHLKLLKPTSRNDHTLKTAKINPCLFPNRNIFSSILCHLTKDQICERLVHVCNKVKEQLRGGGGTMKFKQVTDLELNLLINTWDHGNQYKIYVCSLNFKLYSHITQYIPYSI